MKFSNKDLIKKGYDVEKNKMLVISFNRVMKRVRDKYRNDDSLIEITKNISDLVLIYQGTTCIFNNEKPMLEIEKFIYDNNQKGYVNKVFMKSLQEASRKAFLLGRMDLNIPKVIKDTIAENIALMENVAIKLQSLK